MKVLKKVTKEIEELDDLICNKCGKTLKQIIGSDGTYNFCGLEEVRMVCGYGSLNDGDIYQFSMCEQCVLELMETFTIPPYKKEECFWGKYLEKL